MNFFCFASPFAGVLFLPLRFLVPHKTQFFDTITTVPKRRDFCHFVGRFAMSRDMLYPIVRESFHNLETLERHVQKIIVDNCKYRE